MNNIKISQLDENTSPSLSAVTVVVQNDIAKKSTIQSIKETIFSDDVTVNGTLDVIGDVTIGTDVSVDINGTISHTGNTLQTGNTNIVGNLSVTGETNLTGIIGIVGDTQIVNTWTTPNETEWKIVTYNGHFAGTITGGSSTYWFPFSSVPFSNGTTSCGGNSLRSGIIEYTAYFNGSGCGSEIGQIMFSRNCGISNDNWVVSQQDCDSIIVTDGDDNGFYFYNDTDPNDASMLIQWTARLFYVEESFC